MPREKTPVFTSVICIDAVPTPDVGVAIIPVFTSVICIAPASGIGTASMQMTEVKTGVFSRGTHTKVSAGYVLRDAPCVYNSTVFKRTTAGVKNIGRVDPFRTPLPSPSFGNKLLGISVIIFAVLKGLSARSMPIQCGIPLQCGTGIPLQRGTGIKPLQCGTAIPLQCGTGINLYSAVLV